MVFSFFKSKKDTSGKMPELVIARPMTTPAPPNGAPAEAKEDAGWDTVTRPNGDYGIEVLEESDPYAEIAEHVAILFANGQYDAARSTLESVIQNNSDPGAFKLWGMLFDLLRIRGEQAAFDALCLNFARVCELSPPSWSLEPETRSNDSDTRHQASGIVVLQGVISDDTAVFDNLLQALSKGEARTLDMRRLASLSSEASAKLARVLQQARRRDLAWGLLAAEILTQRLAERTVTGQAQNEAQWLLMLELFQFLGWEEQFEDKAVDYAVTFEVSPPAWEPPKTAPAIQEEDSDAPPPEKALTTPMTTVLEGEILQGKLGDVENLLIPGEECKLDFSRVKRLDFVSAGALAVLLKNAKTGPVIISHANRLVAELLRVMGIDQIARVELSRH
jgi:anti-anti-sigma regulatory factor